MFPYIDISNTSARTYAFEIQVGTDGGAETDADIYFRIFGTKGIWSDWFIRNDFTTRGATYNWNQEINPSVGNVTKVVVLSKQTNGFTLNTITIDQENSYTVNDVAYGADIDCTTTENNACSYVVVFFNGTDFSDHTTTYASGGCDLDTQLPSISPSQAPSQSPTQDCNSFKCDEDEECHSQTITCEHFCNCDVECTGIEACESATIMGNYSTNLHWDVSGSQAGKSAKFYCPNNLQNKNHSEDAIVSEAVIDCTGWRGCLHADFYCSHTNIVNITCVEWTSCQYVLFEMNYIDKLYIDCDSPTDHWVCRNSDFVVSNVNEFDLILGSHSADYTDLNLSNICYLSLVYDDDCIDSRFVFDKIDVIYSDSHLWNCICESASSGSVRINSSLIVIDNNVITLNDLTSCTKYTNGNMTIENYNPYNIQSMDTVDIDGLVENCYKSQWNQTS